MLRKWYVKPTIGYILNSMLKDHFDLILLTQLAAGIPAGKLKNQQTGCYVGCMTLDYELMSSRDTNNLAHAAASGLSQAMIANRLSWFFDMHGPSLTLDTACSSSLTALHLSCQALREGEINMVSP
jgi:acyl transferase domain-containing protein